jgi:hypothetical protein
VGGGGALTASIREQITAAVFTKAQSTAGLGGRVYRSRVEAFSRNSTPALVVECVRNTPNPTRAGVTTMPHELEFRFLLMLDDPIPEQAADPILVDLHDRLMLDLTLGGLSMDILPGETRWDQEVNGVAVVTSSYLVQYRTLIKDLTDA